MKRLAAMLLVPAGLAACGGVSTAGDPGLRAWTQERLEAAFRRGTTTRSELEARLGARCEADARPVPLAKMAVFEGCSLSYTRSSTRHCLSSAGSPIALGCSGQAGLIEAVRLDFVFDRRGVLQDMRRVDGRL